MNRALFLQRLNSFRGYEVRKSDARRQSFHMKKLGVDLVFDIGANTGQFAKALRKQGYKGTIVSFEPQKATHEKLLLNAQHNKNWIVHSPVALGAKKENATLNISLNSVSSSLLKVSKASIEAQPSTNYVGVESIQVITFDEVFPMYQHLGKCVALKIDCQGFEKQVLLGAQDSLKNNINMLIVEMSLIEVYEGSPKILELLEFLGRFHFKLWDIYPGFRNNATGRLLQADGLFQRTID